MQQRLKYHIHYVVDYDLILKLNIKNIYKIPKKTSIILQSNQKKLLVDPTIMYPLYGCFELLSFQRPIFSISKNAVSSFQLRKEQVLGCLVTLKKLNLYYFFDKLIFLYFPKIKSLELQTVKFLKKRFVYAFGLKSVIPFEDIEYQYLKTELNFGLNVFIMFKKVGNPKNIPLFLSALQFPLKK
uniref:Ribosomal protein L5 n=1 Tax=Cyanophora biloba TaxID=1489483 RepID=A0A873WV08_9EUKA|nr:ribosomal protein L5 [Cyanophora biloba]QPB15019.1 ribosomal protein L5 [Cyanophora biloba]